MEEPTETVPPTPNDGNGMAIWEMVVLYHARESRSCLMEGAKTVRLRQ